MLRAHIHAPATAWPRAEASDGVTLDFDARHRRRIRLTTDAGEAVLLDLAKAVPMADGDGLQLQDGRWLIVHAAAEPLLEVRCRDPLLLMRVAWHLGNRHLPTEVHADLLRIRPDHVIAGMVRGLGAEVREVTAPFQPEGGAYGGHAHGGHAQGGHGHDHHDDDGHDDDAHDHDHDHAHGHHHHHGGHGHAH
jgi:urease accessory protein